MTNASTHQGINTKARIIVIGCLRIRRESVHMYTTCFFQFRFRLEGEEQPHPPTITPPNQVRVAVFHLRERRQLN